MGKALKILMVVFIPSLALCQFSISVGNKHIALGENFGQNQLNMHAAWLKKRFQFSTELGIAHKRIDYSSNKTVNDYSHGPPGYSTTQTWRYVYSAQINYTHLNLGTFFDWSLIDTKQFKLFFGYFIDLHFLINEREKKHQTFEKYSVSQVWGGDYSSSSEVYPVSNESFNAIDPANTNLALGFKLSPRQEFNDFYIQLDAIFGGVSMPSYSDVAGHEEYIDDPVYEPLIKNRPALYFSYGISVGRYL